MISLPNELLKLISTFMNKRTVRLVNWLLFVPMSECKFTLIRSNWIMYIRRKLRIDKKAITCVRGDIHFTINTCVPFIVIRDIGQSGNFYTVEIWKHDKTSLIFGTTLKNIFEIAQDMGLLLTFSLKSTKN